MALSSQVIVSNQDYEAAWANESNRRVIATVSRHYHNKMPSEEILFCVQMALFKCMQKHKDSAGNKFTTSLHQYVKWELQKGLRNYYRELSKHPPMMSIDDFNVPSENWMESYEVRDCMSKLSKRDRILMEQKFVHGMSLRDIVKEDGSNHQTINRRLHRATKKFNELWRQ